jgi:hypothetical protein
MTRPRETPPPVLLLLALVVLFSLFRYAHDLLKLAVGALSIDFAHYYTYSTVVRMGLNPFDPASVARVDALLGIRRAGAAANYPPLFYVLMLPWTLLPFRRAALAWLAGSQLCLLGTLGLCFRRLPSVSPVGAAASLFVVLNYQPLFEDLALGQVNVLLLFLVTLAWWAMRTGHGWTAAGAIATTIHIKAQYGLLLPVLFWTGQRRTGWRALLLTGLGVGVGLFLLGPEHYRDYARYLLSPPDYLHAWTANLSPRATIFRVFSFTGSGQFLGNVLALAIDAALLAGFALALPRSAPPGSPVMDWAWGLGLTAIPLLSPLTEEHHLALLLFPLTLLWLIAPEGPMPVMDRTLLITGTLLLGGRYSLEQFPAFHQGPLSLLAAGKLLGMLALAWSLMRRLRGRPDTL